MSTHSRMDILDKLFGGSPKVKVMRLFLFNNSDLYDSMDVARRAKLTTTKARVVCQNLEKMGLLKKRTFYKDSESKKTKGKAKKIKTKGWALDSDFPYLRPLQSILVNTEPCSQADIVSKFNSSGRVKLIIISGIFIQEWDSRIDLLLVGDNLKRANVDNAIRVLESEIGKELRYTILDTPQFTYRLSVFDKLVRDILDYPHKVILDKIGVENYS